MCYNILRADGVNVRQYLFNKIDTTGDEKGSTHPHTHPIRPWLGFLTFDRDKFSDEASRNTARVINEIDADILCTNEIESHPIMYGSAQTSSRADIPA